MTQSGKLLFFCDESSHVGNPYLVVSGLAVKLNAYAHILEQIETINKNMGVISTVKWNTFRKRRDNVHKAYVDLLFDLIKSKCVHYHILIRNFSDFDHSESGPRQRVDSVSKMYYQLLLHKAAKYYGAEFGIHVRPDSGCCTDYLPEMHRGLNSAAVKEFKLSRPPFLTIQPRKYKKEKLLWLNDVTLGAIAAYKNGRHNDPHISEHKKELMRYVLKKTGWPNYDGNHGLFIRSLTLWNHISKNRGPRP